MMKKIFLSFLCLTLLVSATFFVSGCKKKHTHSFTEQTVKDEYLSTATDCTNKAKYFYSCSCGEKGSGTFEYGSPLGHSLSEWKIQKEATETEKGLKTRNCTRSGCNYSESENIPMLSHTHKFNLETATDNYLATAATCTEKAKYYYSCSCGEKGSETFEYGEALNHSFTNYVSDNNATCTENGTKTAKCDRCSETDTITDAGSKLNHSFTNYVSDNNATCTKDGTKTAKCDRCDETNTVTDVDSKLNHSFTNYVSNNNATCTEDGTKTAKCDRCDETDTITDENSAKGHDYSTEWTVDVEPTCVKTGTKSRYCTRCKERTDETSIPLLSHTYEDEICSFCGTVELIEAIGLEYTLSEDGTYYIVSEIGECSRKHFIIPATYNGLPVKEIAEMAFYKKNDIVQVVLPDSIEKIDRMAFYACLNLQECSLNNGLEWIGDSAFEDCSSLTSIDIPDHVGIGSSVFQGCSSLKTVKIGNGTTIGWEMFYNCLSLTNVTILDDVTFISESAFQNCYSLTNITIPDVTYISKKAFYNCWSLVSINTLDNLETIREDAFYGCDRLVKTVKGVSYVNKWVVECEFTVSDIEIKTNTVGIAESTFSNRPWLKNITYNGTKSEWEKIIKRYAGISSGVTVHCSDGDLKY